MGIEDCSVISGVGLATPLGCGFEEFWCNAMSSSKVTSYKKLFGESGGLQLVSEVNDASLQHGLDRRALRKLDRFSIFAISAAKQCIENAKLEITENTCDRMGILIGNSFGGWAYVEEQMRALYKGDMDAINAYISTAWFPTAAQGEISILLNIKGYSKTFSAESISAGIAFEHAQDLLKNDVLDYIIVGGSETPLTQLVYNSCIENQIISHEKTALCEGAALFVVEKYQTAKARNAKIYAKLLSCGMGENLQESMGQCLENAGKKISEIDLIMLNNSGCKDQDVVELKALSEYSHLRCHVHSIKGLYGNSISANMAIDVALVCGILNTQSLPPATISLAEEYRKAGFLINEHAASAKIKNILINGINCDGECLSLMISKENQEYL